MLRALLLLVGISSGPILATAAEPPMPPVVVLIVCKTVQTGEVDPNASFTKHDELAWDYTDAMMHCRREEVAMYDRAVDAGADPRPFTLHDCQMSGMMLGANFDAAHRKSAWRFWRVACPVPIVSQNPDGSENIIAWKIPDCGHQDTVVCESDTAI